MHSIKPRYFEGSAIELADGLLSSNETISRPSLLHRNATSADTTTQLTSKVNSPFDLLARELWEDPFQSGICDHSSLEVQIFSSEKMCTFAIYGPGASSRGQVFAAHNMVNRIDIISSKQVVQYARYWAVDQADGPLIFELVTHCYGGHSMRSTEYLEEWGVAPEQELKAIDNEVKTDAVVKHASTSNRGEGSLERPLLQG
ncbi:hypothetical protein BKA70DRAFT_1218555 [Coprinopsis sp. MPI-PUGE-AT-0042]|nr:hypothetical protein BKA70DRAFT_1218555 [Coprinopsis sp. MPI-PUGE-AT-0042]